MKKSKYIFILLILILTINCSGKETTINSNDTNSNFQKESISIVKNNIAPSFSLNSINGSIINYESNSDTSKPKFLFFLSRYWGKCRSELRNLIPIYSKYSNDIDFLIISIEQNESKLELKNFSSKENYPWQIYSADKNTLQSLNVTQQSTKIFINKENKIIYKANYGEGSVTEWTELFNSAIN